MHITGSHFNYYMVCHRKLWLFSNGIQMEHTSDLVLEGRLVHESSYQQRSEKYTEIEMDGIKIDYFDAKSKIVHEVKKSDSYEIAHEWQLKYYLCVLHRNGVEATGILEYPKLRKTLEVVLSQRDMDEIRTFETNIKTIISDNNCPEKQEQKKCKNCSYFDFCWSGEE